MQARDVQGYTSHIKDPEIDRIVNEINLGGGVGDDEESSSTKSAN